MQCPSCKFEVSRGTAICPSCDEILDSSVFDGSTVEAESFDEKTGDLDLEDLKPKAPPPPPRTPSAKPPLPATSSSKPGTPPPPPAKAALPGDPRKRAGAAAPAPPPPQKGKRRRWARPSTSADEVLTDGWAAFRNLPPFEQLSIVMLLFGSIAMLFPWRTTDTSGEEIGIFLAPIAILPLFVAGAAAAIRMSTDLRGFRPDQLAVIQLVCGVVLLGFCAYFFYETLDAGVYRSSLGKLKLHTSTPEVGCVACGIAAIGIAASAAWTYLEERGYE